MCENSLLRMPRMSAWLARWLKYVTQYCDTAISSASPAITAASAHICAFNHPVPPNISANFANSPSGGTSSMTLSMAKLMT